MSEFVYFTPQEKEAARNADNVEMLERQGERLKRSGSEYEWGEGSERVTIRGNLWYHQYEQKGGNAVSFVQKFMDKTYVEAMKFILGDGAGEVKQAEPKQAKAKEKRQFEPPALAEEPRKAYPMKVRLKLFFDWGISFGEPYTVKENANRKVEYAEKKELIEKIVEKYCPDLKDETEEKSKTRGGIGGQTQVESRRHFANDLRTNRPFLRTSSIKRQYLLPPTTEETEEMDETEQKDNEPT